MPSNGFYWKVYIGWIALCSKTIHSIWTSQCNLIDELSIQHGLSSGTRLMGNLHIHLMIYSLDCRIYSFENADYFITDKGLQRSSPTVKQLCGHLWPSEGVNLYTVIEILAGQWRDTTVVTCKGITGVPYSNGTIDYYSLGNCNRSSVC